MKCFYHTDMDGKCAAAIVYRKYKGSGETAEYIPINYNHDFPFADIGKNETVIIVDFSLQKPGEFERLLEITENIIWIDHHKTAIEKHSHLVGKIKGIQRDGSAGCELTWEYFFPGEPMPKVVKLLGDYDTWTYKYGDETRYLQTGIHLEETNPESPNWDEWFKIESDILDNIIMNGNTCFRYQANKNAGMIKGWAFFTEFEGYKAVACNQGSTNSLLFDSVEEDFDLMLPFCFDGKQWTVSIYSTKDIDCGTLAKKYGGGGHKKAAGFQCKELPFVRDK